jgi:dinuclear metal center YbgI/SA1388 family protein
MAANGNTIIKALEQWVSKRFAMEGDRIGLQVGTLNKNVRKVMVTLDVMIEQVIDEAIDRQVDLIIAHHAAIYKPLSNLRTDTPAGRIYQKLLRHDIAVYVAHTNFDIASGGMSDLLAEALKLHNIEVMESTHTQNYKKLVVFVPSEHVNAVHQAISQAGAGWIGNYSHCSFQLEGLGTFMPGEGTNPFIGSINKLERVNEIRIETVVPADKLNAVVPAMLKAHPYEEVAYDVFQLEIEGEKWGLGRIGTLPEPLTLDELALQVKKAFDLNGLRVVGNGKRKVSKVAVLGGAGDEFVHTAAFRGAEVLITGDIDYHTGHEAEALGISLIDAGHNIEKVMKKAVQSYLLNESEKGKWDIEVIVSNIHTDPFRFL